MTIQCTINGPLVINTMGESDDFNDFLNHIERNIGQWKNLGVIWDMNRMDFGAVDSESIRALINNGRELALQRSGGKTAFVVASDVGFGMMRMFTLIAEPDLPIEFRVFRDQAAASAWLTG